MGSGVCRIQGPGYRTPVENCHQICLPIYIYIYILKVHLKKYIYLSYKLQVRKHRSCLMYPEPLCRV